MKKIAEKYKKIRSQIDTFAEKANRSSEKIKLMTVSKFHSENEIIEAIKGGAEFFGENRVQEAVQKFPQILNEYPNVQLHFIGQLQTNKVKQIVEYASCIQSVDRLKLLEEIEKRAKAINKKIDILFEVHTAEESKSGFRDIHMLKNVIKKTTQMKYVIPKGFMTMAPYTDDREEIRASFRKLNAIALELQAEFPTLDLSELSMGMSNDYKIAIEEGSTLVRIGTAIFGERDYLN